MACYGLLWFTYALLSVCVIISNIYDFFLLMAYYWHRKPLYFLQEFGIVYIAHVKCFNRYIVDMVDYHKWLAIISQLGGFLTWSSKFSYIQSLKRERLRRLFFCPRFFFSNLLTDAEILIKPDKIYEKILLRRFRKSAFYIRHKTPQKNIQKRSGGFLQSDLPLYFYEFGLNCTHYTKIKRPFKPEKRLWSA